MQYKKTFCLILLLSTLYSVPAFACETTLILAEAEVITLDQAVKRIKDGKRGKVLGAETLQLKGHPVHVIKVLTKKGHVKKIHIKTKSHQ